MISCWGPGPSVPLASVQATRALVSAASPGASTPSSLVTRILTCAHPIGRHPGASASVTGSSCAGHRAFTGDPGLALTHAEPLVCFNSSQCRPERPGSPSPHPRASSGASGTAARRSSSVKWAPRCAPTPSARAPSSTGSGPTSGRTRAGARCSHPGPTAWPTAGTSSTGCAPRPPWTSPSGATPSTGSCAGSRGRSRPGTRISSRSACNSTPRPATPSRSCSRSSTTWAGTG